MGINFECQFLTTLICYWVIDTMDLFLDLFWWTENKQPTNQPTKKIKNKSGFNLILYVVLSVLTLVNKMSPHILHWTGMFYTPQSEVMKSALN